MSTPTYLSRPYLEGSYECGNNTGEFDATDPSLIHISGVYMDLNPSTMISYCTIIDRVLFRLLQFLKAVGNCTGNEVRFDFFDDTNGNYHYNQFSALTLTENQLVDMANAVNQPHFSVLQEFAMKRNFSMDLSSRFLEERWMHMDSLSIIMEHSLRCICSALCITLSKPIW